MILADEKQAEQFVTEQTQAYASVRDTVGARVGTDRCMVEGRQWISEGMNLSSVTTLGRRWTNWNPDTPKLVATVNRIRKLINESSAASYPARMEVGAGPPDRDAGIEAANRAQVYEALVNYMTGCAGYLNAARQANYRRCIDGTHGIGLSVGVGGAIRSFTFDSIKLTLDPHCQELELADHPFVILNDVWTADKIERVWSKWGVKLERDKLQTVGQLMSLEMEMNQLSQNRLYANLPTYSTTKGAVIVQVHVKDDADRFSTALYGLRMPGKQIRWVNFDNQETPFGGPTGMPFMLLHGYRHPDSMWSTSDASMLKDDQDRLNLLATLFFRQLQKNAGFQWLVDQNSLLGDGAESFKDQFNNYVGGVVTYKGTQQRDRPVAPPQLVQYPAPQSFIQDAIQMYQGEMREQVHRAPVTAGAMKTHVPDQTYQSALQQANQVPGNRIGEDLARHEALLMTLLGTTIKQSQASSPAVLAELSRAGFDESDFGTIADTDPTYPPCELKVRESSIRYQSKEEKETRMWAAVDKQAMSPMKLRMALADADISVDDADKQFDAAAKKAALRVLLGEEYEPTMLGEYSEMFLTALRRARQDRRAQGPTPEATETRARLDRAIQAQLVFTNQETAMAAAAQAPPTEPAQGAGGQQAPVDDAQAQLGQIIAALSGPGSGSVPAQPAA